MGCRHGCEHDWYEDGEWQVRRRPARRWASGDEERTAVDQRPATAALEGRLDDLQEELGQIKAMLAEAALTRGTG